MSGTEGESLAELAPVLGRDQGKQRQCFQTCECAQWGCRSVLVTLDYNTDGQLKSEGPKRGERWCAGYSQGPHLGQVSLAPSDLQQQKCANLFRAPESVMPHVLSQSHSCCAVLHFFIKPMLMVSILHFSSQEERQISSFAGNSILCGPALGEKSGNIYIYCPAGHVCMVYR